MMLERTICFMFICITFAECKLELTVEGRESGFFLRADDDQDRFAPLHSRSMLRAAFGPFAARSNETTDAPATDVTARLVTREVRRDRPVLRVLFQGPPKKEGGKGAPMCLLLYVHNGDQHLMAACSPGRDGACLAEATLPVTWWPPLQPKGPKRAPHWVRVEWATLRGSSLDCGDSGLPVTVSTGLPERTFLSEVALSGTHGSYEEVNSDDVVRILVPQGPVYPRSKVYVPVYLQPNPVYPPYVFVIRARVKSGLRILGAQVSPLSQWSISIELNPRQTVATVTAFVKDTSTKAPQEEPDLSAQEVFTWLFEVDEDATYNDNGRITWQLRYMLDSSMAEQYDFDDDNAKITSRLDIQKDDVQAVLPIAKSSQLLNTAVLNGRQVSQPMKVFVVSQAGKVGDVTLQSSCHAADESILKVSPSCTSVYLDGSEIRGSQNASILVKYGTYTGQAHFLVWMPELPLTIRISDTKLSQIKGWRTPHLQRGKPVSLSHSNRGTNGHKSSFASSTTRSDRWLDKEDFDVVCRLRYQQGDIDVYTKFFSVDHNSGRESYLLSRRAELRITELVAPFLRVADTRIATLQGTIVRGLQSGRTEVQVLSPITGRVSGAKEVRVGTDKETITHLEVSVVTGLHLTMVADETMPGVYIAQTSIQHKLTSEYQEGLLDIRLHFSDGSWASLSEVSDMDYRLSVDTFDRGVVAFAPMAGLQHPRVIAIGKGRGDLLHVTLELAERCQKRRSQPLAMAYAYVDVDFATEKKGTKGLQSDSKKEQDQEQVLYQGDARGSKYLEPAVQARQNLVRPSDLTPLEIGMYALLGVFCLAILVFLVSCSVFAVRRKQAPEPVHTSSSEDHAHDWVWLGRATLERNSVNTRCSQALLPDLNGNRLVQKREQPPGSRRIGSGCRGSNLSFPGSEISIRITSNPQELPDEDLPPPSTTYRAAREKRVRIVTNPVPPPLPPGNPPPVPPHRNHLHNRRDWAQGMNYDQLIEYFENLKESNA